MVHIHLDLCSVMLLFIMDQPQTRYLLKLNLKYASEDNSFGTIAEGEIWEYTERSFVLVGSGGRLHGMQIEFASAGSVLVHVWLFYFP